MNTQASKPGAELLEDLRAQADELRIKADQTGLSADVESADVAQEWLDALEKLVHAVIIAIPVTGHAPATQQALRDSLAKFM